MFKLLSIFTLCLIGGQGQQLFNNPILDQDAGDPAAIRIGDFYYLTFTEGFAIRVHKSPILTSFRDAEINEIYAAPEGFGNIWAGELHIIQGQLYAYFCMEGGGTDHRMYVVKADDPNNPMGNWGQPVRLLPDWNFSGIDGTPMVHGNGKLYYVFTTWSFGPLTIHIVPMLDPMTTIGEPLMLKGPIEEWECHDGCVNEGPHFIYRNGWSHCVFSVSSTWGPNYALAVMSIHADSEPMGSHNWLMPTGPSFFRNDEEGVYCTGHAAFTQSPDGTETWMTYHGTDDQIFILDNRKPRIEKIDWTPEGFPVFPRPHGFNNPQPVPSGQL